VQSGVQDVLHARGEANPARVIGASSSKGLREPSMTRHKSCHSHLAALDPPRMPTTTIHKARQSRSALSQHHSHVPH